MTAIREKFTKVRKSISSRLEGAGYDGDSDCSCAEAWDDMVVRVGKLEAALGSLRPAMRSLEAKMGQMEAKIDVLEKCVGEMKGLKVEEKEKAAK